MLPMLAVTSPFVLSYTALPMFIDEASAAAKLPCPTSFIIVALSVSPTGVSIDILFLH